MGPGDAGAAKWWGRVLWGPRNVGAARCGGRRMLGPGAVGAGKREGGVAGAAGCGCRGVWGRGDVGAWKMLVPEMLRQQIILSTKNLVVLTVGIPT